MSFFRGEKKKKECDFMSSTGEKASWEKARKKRRPSILEVGDRDGPSQKTFLRGQKEGGAVSSHFFHREKAFSTMF